MPIPKLTETPTEGIVAEINRVGLSAYVQSMRAEGRPVNKSTVSRWLKRAGYRARPQYVKVAQP